MARPNTTRARILEAAAQVASRKGISATTMDDVATGAGVAKGSLYYNFEGKDELFAAVFASTNELLVPTLRATIAEASPADRLRALIRAFLARLEESPAMAKLLVSEMLRVERSWAESLGELRVHLIDLFVEAIAASRCTAEGKGDPTASAAPRGDEDAKPGTPAWSPELVGVSVLGATLLAGAEWIIFEPHRTLDEVVASVCAATGCA